MGLLLQAVDVVDRHHWRWLLVDGGSHAPLADHQVVLDPADAQVAAFENLYSHVRWNADPQRRTESETELVARLGAWIREQVLGSTVGAAIVDAAPVTVRVVVPPEAEFLLFRPLELAHVGGTPLAMRGGAGEFLLKNAAGSPDPISTPELLQLLRRGRHRIKLAVVSACQSAAATTAETLRWLQLDEPAEQLEAQAKDVTPAVGGVARELTRELGCAVVAMRYPVADDFAVDFAEQFYRRLFDGAQPVDAALARAVPAAAGARPSAARPALSAGTPAVFGSAAIGMQLRLPTGEPTLDPPAGAHVRFPGRARAVRRPPSRQMVPSLKRA